LTPKVVTFDCADTLIDLKWEPVGSVRLMAERLGVDLPDEAFQAYGELFLEWRPHYEAANATRDVNRLTEFWRGLYENWLAAHGHSSETANRFLQLGDELAYGGERTWFPLFADTLPCLERLRQQGYRMAVISNWDLSLHRILDSLEISPFFERIIVSLEEGVEKPDPELFRVALDRLGVSPGDVVHVGDRQADDVEGAHAAGIRALLLDRTAARSMAGVIRALDELPEAFAWSV
jgi:putative hydrolase of the HAD superfamily